MPEVFHYPASYPALWLDYYFLATWVLGMLFLGLVWAIFYRFGKFTYGVDLGCFWKTGLLVLLTTVSLGGPMYYNTRFAGEHGQDGDSIKIAGDQLLYLDRKGNEKRCRLLLLLPFIRRASLTIHRRKSLLLPQNLHSVTRFL